MTTNATQVALDVRPVAPKDRFELIMGTYEALPAGGTMELMLDHDPTCMYFTLLSTKGEGKFDFDYLDQGPIDWRVLVRKHEGSV
jgi:uncharacterized protein (DUF2249 family)